MTRYSELPQLARLAIPLAFVQVGYQLASFVDTALAGRLDELSLGATGLGSSIFFAISVVGVGIALGMDPLVSQAMGAGNPRLARRTLWQGWYTAILVSAPITVMTIGVASQLERFGVVPELAAMTRTYVYARLPSLVPLLASVTVRSYLQAAHVTRPIVIATIATNVFNLIADWLLAFGDDGLTGIGLPPIGLPAFGVAGIAWATTVAHTAQFGVMALAVPAVDAGTITETYRRADPAIIKKILRVGTPLGLQLLAEVGVFSAVLVVMGGISVLAAASHQVALMLASLSFSVCLGVGSATSVQVGRAIGRGDGPGTRRAGFTGIGIGALFMLAPAVLMLAVPELLARLLTDDPEVVAAAAVLLRVGAAFQIVDGVQAVAAGALRGAGVTDWPFVANLLGHWGVGLPVGLALAFGVGLGPVGLWWGLTCGLALVAVSLALKFASISRKTLRPT